jgi:hypothetical protein
MRLVVRRSGHIWWSCDIPEGIQRREREEKFARSEKGHHEQMRTLKRTSKKQIGHCIGDRESYIKQQYIRRPIEHRVIQYDRKGRLQFSLK